FFQVDRKKAADYGLSAEGVILQLVAAMNSSVSINRNFWIDTRTGNQYFVAVQYAENPDLQLADVLKFYATGTNQQHGDRLNQLVTVRRDYRAVELTHVSLYRTFDVLVNTEKRAVGGVAADIQKVLAAVRPEVAQEIDKLEKHRDALLQMKSASK